MYESVRSWRNTVLIDNIQPTSESTNPMPHQQVNNKIYFLAYAYRARKVFYVLYIMFLSHAVFTMTYRGGPLSGGPPRASAGLHRFWKPPKTYSFPNGILWRPCLRRASAGFRRFRKHPKTWSFYFEISWRPSLRRAFAGLHLFCTHPKTLFRNIVEAPR